MRLRVRRFRGEAGEGLVSGLILVAGVLVPLLFLVPLFARLEQARLNAEQAARDGVRAAVEASDASAARTAAVAAIGRAQPNTPDSIVLTLQGAFARGEQLEATTSVRVPLMSLPLVGAIGTVTIHGQATAPVDQYRSLTQATP